MLALRQSSLRAGYREANPALTTAKFLELEFMLADRSGERNGFTFECMLLLSLESGQASHQPLKCALYKILCVFLDADTMSEDQLVEIPRKQFIEGLPSKVSVNEG